MTTTIEANSPEQVITDYRSLVQSEHRKAKSLTEGRWQWIQLRAKGDESSVAAVKWTCLAHLGTLEKISRLLPGDGPFSEFEVVATARNLFENLVWLRLFESDVQYGLVFYIHLLRDQKKSIEAHIEKAQSELPLFAELDRQESQEIEELGRALRDGSIEKADAQRRMNEIRVRTDKLARSAFAAYGAAAKFNGFAYQSHLLTTQIIPKLRQDLAEVEQKIADFDRDKSRLLTPAMIAVADTRKINWFEFADRVGLGAEYRFIYSFASKMLHSTPMSTVPNGELNRSEMTLLLEYAYIAVGRIFDCVQQSPLPGVPDIMLVHMDDDPPESEVGGATATSSKSS